MAEFNEAFTRTMRHEGGYVDDPVDPGGETYRGISRGFNPSWSGWDIIDEAKRADNFPDSLSQNRVLQDSVVFFYTTYYWNKVRGDVIPEQSIANELFDSGVHLGVLRAVEFIQQALNVLNRNGRLYDDLVVDGIFGRNSQAALTAYLNNDPPELLLKILNVLQGMFYIERMNASPTAEKYARGWFNRVELTVA